jgi:hypothetical protein
VWGEDMRTCPDCQRELSSNNFFKYKATGKLYTYCKKCNLKRLQKRRRTLWESTNVYVARRGQPRKYDYDLIIDLIRAGFQPKNIAKEVGCDQSTVNYVKDKFVERVE